MGGRTWIFPFTLLADGKKYLTGMYFAALSQSPQ
jgi:hypothetical protein